jgi:hypothetical protein
MTLTLYSERMAQKRRAEWEIKSRNDRSLANRSALARAIIERLSASSEFEI